MTHFADEAAGRRLSLLSNMAAAAESFLERQRKTNMDDLTELEREMYASDKRFEGHALGKRGEFNQYLVKYLAVGGRHANDDDPYKLRSELIELSRPLDDALDRAGLGISAEPQVTEKRHAFYKALMERKPEGDLYNVDLANKFEELTTAITKYDKANTPLFERLRDKTPEDLAEAFSQTTANGQNAYVDIYGPRYIPSPAIDASDESEIIGQIEEFIQRNEDPLSRLDPLLEFEFPKLIEHDFPRFMLPQHQQPNSANSSSASLKVWAMGIDPDEQDTAQSKSKRDRDSADPANGFDRSVKPRIGDIETEPSSQQAAGHRLSLLSNLASAGNSITKNYGSFSAYEDGNLPDAQPFPNEYDGYASSTKKEFDDYFVKYLAAGSHRTDDADPYKLRSELTSLLEPIDAAMNDAGLAHDGSASITDNRHAFLTALRENDPKGHRLYNEDIVKKFNKLESKIDELHGSGEFIFEKMKDLSSGLSYGDYGKATSAGNKTQLQIYGVRKFIGSAEFSDNFEVITQIRSQLEKEPDPLTLADREPDTPNRTASDQGSPRETGAAIHFSAASAGQVLTPALGNETNRPAPFREFKERNRDSGGLGL